MTVNALKSHLRYGESSIPHQFQDTKTRENVGEIIDTPEVRKKKELIAFYERCFPQIREKFSVKSDTLRFSGTQEIRFHLHLEDDYGQYPYLGDTGGYRSYENLKEMFLLFGGSEIQKGEMILSRTASYALIKLLGLKNGRIYFTNSHIPGIELNAWALWVGEGELRLKPVHQHLRLGKL